MVKGRAGRRSGYGRLRLSLGALLGLVLLAGCQTRAGRQRPPQPRELPFPTFEKEGPFPEYGKAAVARANAVAEPETALRRELAEPASAPRDPERQRIPIGATMTASIPAGDDWVWSTADGVTIASYATAEGLPHVLIYVETFSPEIREHPAFEHLRFQATVAPELAGGYLELATARALLRGGGPRSLAWDARLKLARDAALAATRTRGRGLGFRPEAGTFTGWRWVGRNAHGVTIRCGRHLGVWTKQMPAAALSAYAVLGSVADREEQSGAHFAILCAREPRCLAYRELAELLGSIEPAELTTGARLVAAAPLPFTEMLDRVQLSLASDPPATDPSAVR